LISILVRLAGAAVIFGLVLFAVSLGRVPINILWIYLALGALSLGNYWRDKRAAQRDESRVPERSLHLLDFVFGIVGGLVAQVLFRHKTSKTEFATMSALIAAIHIVVLTLLITGSIAYPGAF
jgi:uncharacterized membrane protein YsdA (DUF1294 family)